jgi:hypothetical protein
MGGEVKVTSELNKGSIFSIIFGMMCRVTNPPCPSPVNDKNEVFDSVSRRQLRQSRMKRSGLKYRVLIVNDDPFLLCGY